MFVRYVVGELQLMKRHDFLHPLFTGGRGIGMYVHSFGHFRIRFSGHHPSAESRATIQKHTRTLITIMSYSFYRVRGGRCDFRGSYIRINYIIRFYHNIILMNIIVLLYTRYMCIGHI